MPLLKKIIIIFAIVVLILFIALVVAAWYLGTFASVKLNLEDRGPYDLVVQSQLDSYHKITNVIENVETMLDEKKIKHTTAIVIFYDDPTRIPLQHINIRAGYIVPDSVEVNPPLIFKTIDKRKVAVASIKANPVIATFKTYPAIQEWMQQNGYVEVSSEPTIELYYSNGLVEVEMPVIGN